MVCQLFPLQAAFKWGSSWNLSGLHSSRAPLPGFSALVWVPHYPRCCMGEGYISELGTCQGHPIGVSSWCDVSFPARVNEEILQRRTNDAEVDRPASGSVR